MTRAGAPAGALHAGFKVAVEQLNSAYRDAMSTLADRTVLGRRAERDEVAAAIRWLVSPAASFVHGSTLDVEGGLLATRL